MGWARGEVHLRCMHRNETLIIKADTWLIVQEQQQQQKISTFYDNSIFPINCKTFHINERLYANQLSLL